MTLERKMKGVANPKVPQLISIRSKDFVIIALFWDVLATILRAVANFSFVVFFVRYILFNSTSLAVIHRLLVIGPQLVVIFRYFDNMADAFKLLLLLVAVSLL